MVNHDSSSRHFFVHYKTEALGHRNKILRGVQALRNPLWQHIGIDAEENVSLPEELFCPITHEFMREPVIASGN